MLVFRTNGVMEPIVNMTQGLIRELDNLVVAYGLEELISMEYLDYIPETITNVCVQTNANPTPDIVIANIMGFLIDPLLEELPEDKTGTRGALENTLRLHIGRNWNLIVSLCHALRVAFPTNQTGELKEDVYPTAVYLKADSDSRNCGEEIIFEG